MLPVLGQRVAVANGLPSVAEGGRIGCGRDGQSGQSVERDAAVDRGRGESACCGRAGGRGSIGNGSADIAGYRRVAARARGVGAGRKRLELCT